MILRKEGEIQMLISWWRLWMVFMVVLLVPAIGYGWGYRGWGLPYPTYFQRRRAQRAAAANGFGPFDHHSWGWRGDFVWVVLLIGTFWAVTAIWRR